MPRRKIREEVTKSDILLRTIERTADWVKGHLRLCIIAACIVAVLVGSAYAYKLYDTGQDDKAQYLLSEAIGAFEEAQATGKEEALTKAEGLLNKLGAGNRRGPSDVARMYLGKLYVLKGQNDKAVALYKDLSANGSSDLIRQFSESALKQIEKK
jgi:hypothetical protein